MPPPPTSRTFFCQVSLRMVDKAQPYITDNDNYIINIFLKDSGAEAVRVAEEVQVRCSSGTSRV